MMNLEESLMNKTILTYSTKMIREAGTTIVKEEIDETQSEE